MPEASLNCEQKKHLRLQTLVPTFAPSLPRITTKHSADKRVLEILSEKLFLWQQQFPTKNKSSEKVYYRTKGRKISFYFHCEVISKSFLNYLQEFGSGYKSVPAGSAPL